ncbi:hypothetical protein CRG98_004679 [Punica granatum]|uniref:Disease resistance protein At4g27190-like leucine-rich repeats domain-containing protein n=1 Tax=Punica granatum TaxID=22663 RepID=A0A2I0L2G8_PUNGR|nr:hypothetical protein CRG98_004679 [Punica granatum]
MVEAAAAALAVETYWDGRNLISYATKKLGYADDLEKNYRRLTEEADKLFARRADVEAQVRKDMTKRITKEYNSIKKLQQVILGRLKLNVEWNNDQSEFAWRISKELENKRKKWDGTGVEPIARLVVNECADLPLLIDRVARNFRKKDSINLRDGLWSLRRWPNIRVQGMEEVLEFLKFCYDDLDDETQKISHDRGHSILSDLLDVSLLERSEKMKHVRMNKVIRNMALKISSASKDLTFLVKAREGLQELPKEEEWKGVSGISLMDNKRHRLPEAVDCEDLRTLLLQRNHELTLIPESFFQSMPKLQVLDLHGCGCRSLPSSISSLTSLTALYLNSCRDLMELPANMKALRNLEVLDIRGSGINYLPVQIGHLLQLRCLRISLLNLCIGSLMRGQSRFAQISQNIISRLCWLGELTIDVDPQNQWWDGVVKAIYHKGDGEGVDRAIKKVLAEADAFELIRHKGILSISEFGIESINKMRGCLIEGCTDIESIIHGTHTTEPSLGCLEKMVIKNATRFASIFAGPVHSGSLARLTTLRIYKCPKLLKMFSRRVIQQLSELQHLRVEECHKIREIIMRVKDSILEPGSLPKLKTLILINLPKLRSIWFDNSLEWASLSGIIVYMCQSLIRLPFGKSNVSNLRYIVGQRMWWRKLEWEEDGTEGRLQSLCIFSQ